MLNTVKRLSRVVPPRWLLGSDTNFAAMRSIAPAGQAKGLANLGSDPNNQLPPEGTLRLRPGKSDSAAPAGDEEPPFAHCL